MSQGSTKFDLAPVCVFVPVIDYVQYDSNTGEETGRCKRCIREKLDFEPNASCTPASEQSVTVSFPGSRNTENGRDEGPHQVTLSIGERYHVPRCCSVEVTDSESVPLEELPAEVRLVLAPHVHTAHKFTMKAATEGSADEPTNVTEGEGFSFGRNHQAFVRRDGIMIQCPQSVGPLMWEDRYTNPDTVITLNSVKPGQNRQLSDRDFIEVQEWKDVGP